MTRRELAGRFQRLTNSFNSDFTRSRVLAALRESGELSVAQTPETAYVVTECRRFVEDGKGILRSESRKLLDDIARELLETSPERNPWNYSKRPERIPEHAVST
jgi:hypothetical protein